MVQIKQIAPPTLAELLKETKRDVGVNLNCVKIGIIEFYDSAKQLATIQVAFKQVSEIAPDGVKTFKEYPLLLEVPVVILYGGAGYLTFPITAGDNCLLLFNDREIDQWLYNGSIEAPVSPRVHDISDAIAIVGLRSLQNSISNYLANGVRLAFADSRIDLMGDEIEAVVDLFIHTGDVRITGSLEVIGEMFGENGNSLNINSDITQTSGKILKAGNGATGTFNSVTVADGIVTGGS